MDKPTFPSLPFESFSPQLDTLIKATINKVDREWPRSRAVHPGSKSVVHSLLRVSQNTFATIRFIAADIPANPARRKEFSLQIPPLARTLLDTLFTVVFLFGDLPKRTQWYFRAGWRELHNEHTRLSTMYGADPDWSEYLAESEAFLARTRVGWGITDDDASNPSSIPWWPTPGGMIRNSHAEADRREYLSYLNDWFYKQLSQDTHLSWPGLARRVITLVPLPGIKSESWTLDKLRSDAVITSVIIILATITEVELELRYELRERITYVWGIIVPFSDSARQVYERFYRKFLG